MKLLDLEEYWSVQSIEGKKWQEERYRHKGMVWGKEPGPTVDYAVNLFKKQGVMSVLVVGCGYGRECMYFADQGFHVTGIDFSVEGIKMANDWLSKEPKEQLTFVQGDALNLQFADGSFDAVFSHKVLHQFNRDDRKKMISEIHRVLKPKGIVVISDLSTSDPEYGDGVEIEPDMFERDKRAFRPLYFMSQRTLEEFEAFQIIESEEVDFWEIHPGEDYEHKHVFMRVSGSRVK